MVHVYTGDGKGKTSAALGLALRAFGRGKRVLWTSFLKSFDSGEFMCAPFEVLRGGSVTKFWFQMSEKERDEVAREHAQRLKRAFAENPEVLILDEALGAISVGALDEDELLELARGFDGELILTGRDASGSVLAAADYISEIRLVRHPYERGVPAREGIEF